MNSKVFRNKINLKRPTYETSKTEIMELLSIKGGKKGEFLKFGPYYQTYMYAFFIGYHRKERLPYADPSKKKDFREIGQWQPTGMVDYILMLLFSDKKNIKYDWDELEELEEKNLEEVVSDIIKGIEEYANAGLAYLQEKIQTDRDEFTDPFVFTNILHDVVDESKDRPSFLPINNTAIQVNEGAIRVKKIIDEGESGNVEFKSTLRYCLHQKKEEKKLEHACMKTIAAFLNSNGGTLLIGVGDDKSIQGLDLDFQTFKKKTDLKDEFQKHLDNLIQQYLGNTIYTFLEINFHDLSGKTICEIQVKPNAIRHTILRNMSLSGNPQEFFIRRTGSTVQLPLTDTFEYVSLHWQK